VTEDIQILAHAIGCTVMLITSNHFGNVTINPNCLLTIVIGWIPNHWFYLGHFNHDLRGATDLDDYSYTLNNFSDKIGLKWRRLTVKSVRAQHYARAIKNKKTGTLHEILNSDGTNQGHYFDAAVKSYSQKNRHFAIFSYGAPGSSKSTEPIKLAMRYLNKYSPHKNSHKVTIITARNSLRNDIANKINTDWGFCIKTFELALIQNVNKYVIIDDLSLFPPGYLTLFLILHPHVTNIILTGDILQADFYEPNPDADLNDLLPETLYYSNLVGRYRLYTYRLPARVSNYFGIKSYSESLCVMNISNNIPQEAHSLFPDNQSVVISTENGKPALTYVNSQGHTFDHDYALVLNENTHMVGTKSLFTAMTRGKHNLNIYDYQSYEQPRPNIIAQFENGTNFIRETFQELSVNLRHTMFEIDNKGTLINATQLLNYANYLNAHYHDS
jgi:hypothetical protein